MLLVVPAVVGRVVVPGVGIFPLELDVPTAGLGLCKLQSVTRHFILIKLLQLRKGNIIETNSETLVSICTQ